MKMRQLLFSMLTLLCCCTGALADEVDNDTHLKYTVADDEVTITGFADDFTPGANYALVIPDVIDGKPVVAVGASAFMLCPNLKSVYVQGGLKSFGAYVTAYSPKLEVFKIKKPGTIVSTSNYVYNKKSSSVLTGWGNSKVTIGGKVTIIDGAFAGSSVSQVVLKTCNIQKYAFLHCSNLRYVDISEKYNINDLAFVYCTNFKEVRVKVKPDKKISLKKTPGKIVHYKN